MGGVAQSVRATYRSVPNYSPKGGDVNSYFAFDAVGRWFDSSPRPIHGGIAQL